VGDEYGIQGLNGSQITDDACGQLRKRLLGDCNLRPTDSYSRGYSAKITYEVKCYGLDVETVTGEFTIGTDQDDPEAEVVDGEVVIEQEEDLSDVRERLQQAEREKSGGDEDSGEESLDVPTGEGIRQKRKYTRKLKLASPGVIGGAEDFKE
jgi:hypothetical protein